MALPSPPTSSPLTGDERRLLMIKESEAMDRNTAANVAFVLDDSYSMRRQLALGKRLLRSAACAACRDGMPAAAAAAAAAPLGSGAECGDADNGAKLDAAPSDRTRGSDWHRRRASDPPPSSVGCEYR